MVRKLVIGVLALQGAFIEHIKLLDKASIQLPETTWRFVEVRTPADLSTCDGLIIPGGESTTVALVASRSGLLEPLRSFVKVDRKPVWGTCAGLILLAESANRTKKGGQDLIGGLDVRVNRNYFGRQTESFESALDLPFLKTDRKEGFDPFRGVFIRAPIVENVLQPVTGTQQNEAAKEDTVVAPARDPVDRDHQAVEIMARLPGQSQALQEKLADLRLEDEIGDIIAVRQRNCFATSFHPELTEDARIHTWWLKQVQAWIDRDLETDGIT